VNGGTRKALINELGDNISNIASGTELDIIEHMEIWQVVGDILNEKRI